MRAFWAAMVVGCVGCVAPVSGPVDGGTSPPPDAGPVDAGATVPRDAGPEPFDPCVWDGQGDDLCFADTGVVFDGTGCRTVCGASPRPGRAGVFASEAECNQTCPCHPEKFSYWPGPASAGPLAVNGYCGLIVAVTDAGAAVPWPAERCQELAPWGPSSDQTCTTGLGGQLTRHELAEVCRVSALPQVRQVVCAVTGE